MSADDNEKKKKKEAMKELRKARKEYTEKAGAAAKQQKKSLNAIREQLGKEAKTVPEIADAVQMPTDRVLWFMSAMKKYGEIIEAGKDGGFYRYALVQSGSKAKA